MGLRPINLRNLPETVMSVEQPEQSVSPNKRRNPHELLGNRLRRIVALGNEGSAAVAEFPMTPVTVAKGTDLVVPGEEGTLPFIVLEGWLIEYRLTAEGARQMLDIFISGDLGNLRALVLPTADVFISAATEVRVARFAAEDFHLLIRRYPRFATAFFWMVALRRSRFFEHMVSLGRRKGDARIGHFLAELFVRAKNAGMANDEGFSCPLRLAEIADFVGLTREHTSRVVAQLRRKGLIETRDSHIFVPDLKSLMTAYAIDPTYLHLDEMPIAP
jgi:CRP-like cAMP-binding protein